MLASAAVENADARLVSPGADRRYELGEAMDDETRKRSTLAHVGVALERLEGRLGRRGVRSSSFVAALATDDQRMESPGSTPLLGDEVPRGFMTIRTYP